MPDRTLKQIVLDREPQAQTFYDELFHSPEICSYCFERLRDIHYYEYIGRRGGVLGKHKSDHPDLMPAGVRGHDDKVHDDYGVIRTWRPRTYCRECGRNSAPDNDYHSLKQLTRDIAPNIVDRLGEVGHDVDVDEVRAGIREMKTRDELSSYDTEILAWATGRALRLAADSPTDTGNTPRAPA